MRQLIAELLNMQIYGLLVTTSKQPHLEGLVCGEDDPDVVYHKHFHSTSLPSLV